MERKFKKWTKEDVEKFCEDHFIEQVEWLENFVVEQEAHIEMDDSQNKEGDLVVIIRGKSPED